MNILPADVLFIIFDNVTSNELLSTICRVCKIWRDVAYTLPRWKKLNYVEDLPISILSKTFSSELDWTTLKSFFASSHIFQHLEHIIINSNHTISKEVDLSYFLESFLQLDNCSSLKHVELDLNSYHPNSFNDRTLHILGELVMLESLIVRLPLDKTLCISEPAILQFLKSSSKLHTFHLVIPKMTLSLTVDEELLEALTKFKNLECDYLWCEPLFPSISKRCIRLEEVAFSPFSNVIPSYNNNDDVWTKRLRKINMAYCSISDEEISHLLTYSPHVTSLNLEYTRCDQKTLNAIITELQQPIQELNLNYNYFTDFSFLQHCNHLRVLKLRSSFITPASISFLPSNTLTHLSLRDCSDIDDSCISALSLCSNLQILNILDTRFTSKGLVDLFPQLKFLRKLECGASPTECPIDNSVLDVLIPLEHLQEFHASNCQFTSSGLVQFLTNSRSSLRALTIHRTIKQENDVYVTPNVLKAISQNCQSLRKLCVTVTNVKFAAELMCLSKCTLLQTISLRGKTPLSFGHYEMVTLKQWLETMKNVWIDCVQKIDHSSLFRANQKQ